MWTYNLSKLNKLVIRNKCNSSILSLVVDCLNKLCYSFLISALISSASLAQNLKIELNDGSIDIIQLSEIRKVRFVAGIQQLNMINNDTLNYQLSEIVRIQYVESNTGIESNWNSEVIIFPNPTDSDFKIELKKMSMSRANLRIIDLHGRCVYSELITEDYTCDGAMSKRMRCSELGLNSGVYSVLVETDVKRLVAKLIVAY